MELQAFTARKRPIWCRIIGRPVMEDGKCVRMVGILQDITERKRAEEELRQSEERYRSLFDGILDGIYRSTHEGRFVDVNPAFVKMFGYSSKQEMLDIVDIKKELYFSPKERGSHILDTGKEEVEVYRMRRKDRSEIWVEDHGRYVHDEHGNIIYHEGTLRDITERKRSESALRESEERYRALYENSTDAILLTAPDGRIFAANPEACRIFQRTEDELRRDGRNGVVDLADPKLQVALQERDRTGRFRGELNFRRKDGTIFPAEITTALFKSRDGLEATNMIIRDITERKRMEDELRRYSEHLEELVEERTRKLAESETRFRELANLLPQIVFEIDERGNYTFVNRSGIIAAGYTEQEVLSGLNAAETFIEQDRARIKQNIGRVLAGQELGTTEYTALRKNGSTFPVIIHSEAIIRQGKPAGLRGIAVDITERKKLEEELRASRERLEYIVTSTPAIIYTGKPLPDCSDWHVTYLSSTVTTMLGFEPQKFIGHPEFWESRVHPDDLRPTQAAISQLKEGHYTCDYRFLHRDGTYRWIREEATLVHDIDGKPLEVIGYWIDITELKEMEMRLLKAEHLAGVGETASMIAHDLRNPLQGIAGATHLLRNETLTIEERNEMLQLIENDVEYSDGIVKDLLDYSRAFHLIPIETTPRNITGSALETVRVPDKIKVQNQSQDQPIITADPDRMKRVFVNLIGNAIDAMPRGGILTIESKESNGFVEIAISDTGTGMAREVMENLWKPLQTTKAKGMGVGLAICKRIVDAHGGEISVESKTGEGTTFTIRLPIKPKVVSSV